jgi:hypothetical protein
MTWMQLTHCFGGLLCRQINSSDASASSRTGRVNPTAVGSSAAGAAAPVELPGGGLHDIENEVTVV